MTEPTPSPIERHPLPPFLPQGARLLMLGSFPPPRQRWCIDFFYPNRANMMWEIMGEVFFGDSQRLVDAEHRTFRKEAIETMLCDKGIALFDTASAVIRLQGNASDKFLQVVEKTDVAALLQRLPLCHDIVCTGQKASEIICEDYGVALPKVGMWNAFRVGNREMRLHRMPSSSRAYPMPLKEKAAHYRQMMQEIGILQ